MCIDAGKRACEKFPATVSHHYCRVCALNMFETIKKPSWITDRINTKWETHMYPLAIMAFGKSIAYMHMAI